MLMKKKILSTTPNFVRKFSYHTRARKQREREAAAFYMGVWVWPLAINSKLMPATWRASRLTVGVLVMGVGLYFVFIFFSKLCFDEI